RSEGGRLRVSPLAALLVRINSAPRTRWGWGNIHRFLASAYRKRKKRYSGYFLPVIARAAADSDLNRRPCHSNPSRSTVTVCSTPSHSRTSLVPTTGLRGSAIIALLSDLPSTSSASSSSILAVCRDRPPSVSSWMRQESRNSRLPRLLF